MDLEKSTCRLPLFPPEGHWGVLLLQQRRATHMHCPSGSLSGAERPMLSLALAMWSLPAQPWLPKSQTPRRNADVHHLSQCLHKQSGRSGTAYPLAGETFQSQGPRCQPCVHTLPNVRPQRSRFPALWCLWILVVHELANQRGARTDPDSDSEDRGQHWTC